MKKSIIIGSRGSKLALWQAYFTKKQLEELGCEVTIKIIKTRGDILSLSGNHVPKGEGKGLFTKAIEDKLLEGDIDLAIHSYKDLPTENPDGLCIVANSYREDPADWLVIRKDAVDSNLPFKVKEGAIIGTSSARRKSQFRILRKDLTIKDIRGNVPTRLRKLNEGWDAVILAAAGLKRLEIDLSTYELVAFKPSEMIAAPAQGVLAFQIRENDNFTRNIVKKLHDPVVEETVGVERKVLQLLGGGCRAPIGVFCQKDQTSQKYQVWAMQAQSCFDTPKRVFLEGETAEELPQKVVELLRNTSKKRIFISRNVEKNSFFKEILTTHQHFVSGQSLINFESLPYTLPATSDWVFFSSKNGVHHFFEQKPTFEATTKLAAIGEGTAAALRSYGHQPDFVGESGDTLAVAKAFKTVAEGDKIIFPQALNSLQTIQNQLNGNTVIYNVPVYNNQPLKKEAFDLEHEKFDIIVFTSPLNAQVYCKKYAILAHQKIVAIGKTTAKALEDLGLAADKINLPYATDEMSLADICF